MKENARTWTIFLKNRPFCLFCYANWWISYALPFLSQKEDLAWNAWQGEFSVFSSFSASKSTCPTSVNRCAPRRLADVGHVDFEGVRRTYFLPCWNYRKAPRKQLKELHHCQFVIHTLLRMFAVKAMVCILFLTIWWHYNAYVDSKFIVMETGMCVSSQNTTQVLFFSCIFFLVFLKPRHREALAQQEPVKRFPNRECSYTELTL